MTFTGRRPAPLTGTNTAYRKKHRLQQETPLTARNAAYSKKRRLQEETPLTVLQEEQFPA